MVVEIFAGYPFGCQFCLKDRAVIRDVSPGQEKQPMFWFKVKYLHASSWAVVHETGENSEIYQCGGPTQCNTMATRRGHVHVKLDVLAVVLCAQADRSADGLKPRNR